LELPNLGGHAEGHGATQYVTARSVDGEYRGLPLML
jgi:hypothetical protein